MATLTQVVEQSRAIADYINKIRTELQKSDVIKHFAANRDTQQSVVDSAKANTTSWRLVLDGFAEMLQQRGILQEPPVLPLREEIPRYEQGWLSPGDIVVGWLGYLVDRPRVVVGVTDDGVTWRWLNDDEGVTRNPVRNDRHMMMAGWERVPITAVLMDEIIDEIHEYQQAEIDELNSMFVYFRDKQYLA